MKGRRDMTDRKPSAKRSSSAYKQPAHERFLPLAEEHENLWFDLDDWQVVDKQVGAVPKSILANKLKAQLS